MMKKHIKIYVYSILFVINSFSFSNAQNKTEDVQVFDIYIQTFYSNNQIQFYFNTELKQILMISDVYSDQLLKLKEYTIYDPVLKNVDTKNKKFHYLLATHLFFDKNEKKFKEKKHIILKDKNKLISKEWQKLKLEEINKKHIYTYNYVCRNETFENVIYSDFVGNGNSFVIQKNERDYNLTTFTSDCISSDNDFFLNEPLSYHEEHDFFTCFYDGKSYVFIYGDIVKD